MYSYEIQQTLEEHGYNIDRKTYLNICSTSPQVSHVKYDPYSNTFKMEADGYCWNFAIK